MAKIPKKYKKYDKMSDNDFYTFIKKTYSYDVIKTGDYYSVFNYFGKELITADSKCMIAYWLAIFK